MTATNPDRLLIFDNPANANVEATIITSELTALFDFRLISDS